MVNLQIKLRGYIERSHGVLPRNPTVPLLFLAQRIQNLGPLMVGNHGGAILRAWNDKFWWSDPIRNQLGPYESLKASEVSNDLSLSNKAGILYFYIAFHTWQAW